MVSPTVSPSSKMREVPHSAGGKVGDALGHGDAHGRRNDSNVSHLVDDEGDVS